LAGDIFPSSQSSTIRQLFDSTITSHHFPMFLLFKGGNWMMGQFSGASSNDQASDTLQTQVKLLSIRRKIINFGSMETMFILSP
jgi:hypothetical protein